jgi:hypothetical protein
MLIMQGLGGLNGAPDVLALNSALVKLGYKAVPITSQVTDQTAAALWDAVNGSLAKVQSVAAQLSALPGTSSAGTAVGWLVETMKWIDKSLGDIPYLDSIPGVTINTHFVLAHWADLNAVMGGACSGVAYINDGAGAKCKTVTGLLAAGRSKTYAGIAASAGVFAKVLSAIGAGATTGASTGGTSPNKAALIQAMTAASGAGKIGAGAVKPTVETVRDPNRAPAAGYPGSEGSGLPKWALFALIAAGLVGGVLLARRAA